MPNGISERLYITDGGKQRGELIEGIRVLRNLDYVELPI